MTEEMKLDDKLAKDAVELAAGVKSMLTAFGYAGAEIQISTSSGVQYLSWLGKPNQEDLQIVIAPMGAVERAEQEVQYWRQEAAAMLTRDLGRRRQLVDDGKDDEAMFLFANQIRPLASALEGAIAGDTYPHKCEACGKPVLPGHQVIQFEDIGEAHFNCAAPGEGGLYRSDVEDMAEGGRVEIQSYAFDDMFSPDRVAKILAEVKAVGGSDDDADEATS